VFVTVIGEELQQEQDLLQYMMVVERVQEIVEKGDIFILGENELQELIGLKMFRKVFSDAE
jgi:hypothetical protein